MRPIDPRLLRRAGPARALLAVDAGLALVAALLVLAQAVLLARVAARGFEGATLPEVVAPFALLVAVVVIRATIAWGFELLGRRAAQATLSRLRLELVERRLHDRPAAFDDTEGAELATLAVSGVDALETTFTRYLPQAVLAVTVPIAVLFLTASIDPVSAALMLFTLPLVPVFMWLIGRYTEQRARERWEALVVLAGHFLDVVRGLPTLRAFNRSRRQAVEIARVSDSYRRATMATLRSAFLSGAVLELAATLGIALVAVTVGVRLVEGRLGLEAGLTVLLLAPELYLPLRNLAAQFHASADGAVVTKRLLDLVELPSTAASGIVAAPNPARAPVRLEGVSFTYPARADAVLDSIDLELRPGETLVLVGPSGSGKSTIARLVLRFDEPTRGRVRAGDLDLADCDVRAWRQQIAWLPQRPTMFHRTVADNVRLGDTTADEGRVRAAMELAGADEFVRALPDGYDTVIGEGGRPLSAGEGQRLALARAFLRDAPLVILDEPTANLDPESAGIVSDAIERLRRGRTVLLIAHAPELALHGDRVLEVRAGRIVEAVEDAA